jgi:predicted N-acetyltransferase YhbS
MEILLRPPVAADAPACGRIIYRAFKSIAERHGFPPDFPNPEAAISVAEMLIAHPSIYGVVAETNGQVVGSNFLDERDAICGVGPITVTPQSQDQGVGRLLMEAVIERARHAAGIRLLQDAFNARSMSLYASLGFKVKEPVVLITGRLTGPPPRMEVRGLRNEDLAECAALCRKVHGFDRSNELRDALHGLSPLVARRDGRITAYASAIAFFAHGVAESVEDMQALLLAAGSVTKEPIFFLLPTRQAELFQWCLSKGMRIIKPMTLMAMGEYHEPDGCFFPSVAY